MRYLIRSIGLVLVMLSFISTAFADVAIPGIQGRRPRRPRPPVVRYYEKRDADFTVLQKTEEPMFFLLATLPGPCTWSYTVDNQTTGERIASDSFKNTDINNETEGKKLKLSLPSEGKIIAYKIRAKFSLYGFRDTRFGPKIYYGSKEKLRYASHTYELENENGRYRLREIE